MLAATTSEVTGVVAAVAAVITVVFAYLTVRKAGQTVTEARDGRREQRAAHDEAMRQEVALLGSIEQTRVEAALDRSASFDRDLLLERLAMVNRIAELLQQTADVARSQPPRGSSPLPGVLTHLAVVVGLYEALGGNAPDKLVEWAGRAGGGAEPYATVAFEAVGYLEKLEQVGRDEQVAMLHLRSHRPVLDPTGPAD
jgi:hypothetical protein